MTVRREKQARREQRQRREREAIVSDAQQRLQELRETAVRLWPDRDDPVVLSELVSVLSRIKAATAAQVQPGDSLAATERSLP
jgi:hypothetical protein